MSGPSPRVAAAARVMAAAAQSPALDPTPEGEEPTGSIPVPYTGGPARTAAPTEDDGYGVTWSYWRDERGLRR